MIVAFKTRSAKSIKIREIITVAHRMGAAVFKIGRDESGEYDFQFKFNGIYREN